MARLTVLAPGCSVAGNVWDGTIAPGHQLRGLFVVLFLKIPGLPSGLNCAKGAQSIIVSNVPMGLPFNVTVSCVCSYSSPPAPGPCPLMITVTWPVALVPGFVNVPVTGTTVAGAPSTAVSVRLTPGPSEPFEVKSSEYLKPTAANSGVWPVVHGSPSYGFDPPAIPIQISWAGSASVCAKVEMSASG